MVLQLVGMAAQQGSAGDVVDVSVCEFYTVDLEMFLKKGLECDKDSTDALLRGIYFRGVLLICESSDVGMWSTITIYIDSFCDFPWFVRGFCYWPSTYGRHVVLELCFASCL